MKIPENKGYKSWLLVLTVGVLISGLSVLFVWLFKCDPLEALKIAVPSIAAGAGLYQARSAWVDSRAVKHPSDDGKGTE